MGNGFGEGVSALLETYAKCLNLLKAFAKGGHAHTQLSPTDIGSVLSLRRSIRSDRSRVHDAYRSRLCRDGSRLSRGDATSRSALQRVVGTLRAAIRGVLRLARAPGPDEYGSLTALSNASRAEAIRTMDDLSRRLKGGSPSSRSLSKRSSSGNSSRSGDSDRSRKSKKTKNKTNKKTTTKEKRNVTPLPSEESNSNNINIINNSSGSSNIQDGRNGYLHRRTGAGRPHHHPHHQQKKHPPPPLPPTGTGPRNVIKKMKAPWPNSPSPSPPPPPTSSSSSSSQPQTRTSNPTNHNLNLNLGHNHRISLLSTSTDSTKLGEIPYRARRLRRRSQLLPNSPGGDDNVLGHGDGYYEIRPAYPLYAYHGREGNEGEEKKKRGKGGGGRGLLRRLFGGGGGRGEAVEEEDYDDDDDDDRGG